MEQKKIQNILTLCKNIISIILVVFAVSCITPFAHADILEQINYQGKLTDATGVPVANGSYDAVFKIYDASSGGALLWTGTHTTANSNPLTVTNGVFSTLLGSGTGNTLSLDFSADTYYLGVKIGADAEMTPRKRIGSVPQAFNAKNLKSNGYINITGLPTGTGVNQGTVYLNPTSASSGQTLFGAAVNGTQKLRLTEAGNLELAGAITSGTWNGTAIATTYGGTGTATLGSSGALAYSNGTTYAFSGVGTAGQALVSGATGSPTWFVPTAGSVLFAGTSGILQQDNASFFWDDTSNRLGIGTGSSPSNALAVYTATSADGISVDGSNNPAFIAKSNGVVRGYWTSATSSGSFFGDAAANDMIFRSETGGSRVLFGVGSGSSTMAVSSSGVAVTGNVGIGDASPASALTVGSGDLFQVNSSGAIVAATGITSSGSITLSGFSANGGPLYTNGSGTLAQVASGTTGQCLNGVTSGAPVWGSCGGGGAAWSDITDPTANLTLAMGAYTTTLNAASLTTGTGLTVNANALTSGISQQIASSATAFTGSLFDVTLSGSNAANTGSLQTITNSGTANANTSLYIKHYATGTNNLAFRVDDVSGDTTPFVIDGAGNVGIGIATPGNLLQVYGTGTQMKISYDATNYATMAVDASGFLAIASFGKKIQMLDENLWVCGGGSCPAITPAAGQGNIIVENAVYFGNGFKAAQVSASELGVYNSAGSLVVTFDEVP